MMHKSCVLSIIAYMNIAFLSHSASKSHSATKTCYPAQISVSMQQAWAATPKSNLMKWRILKMEG